jgi:hypothetical protein
LELHVFQERLDCVIFRALIFYEPGISANGGASGWHALGDNSVSSNSAVIANCDVSNQFGSCSEDDSVPNRRVTFDRVQCFSPKCHTVINQNVIANLCRFTDYNSASVIDDKPSSDLGSWVNLYS